MVRRKIIKIDENKCTGCGNCVISCAEGAIELVDGKARVVSDKYCDGLGACIRDCPVGALTLEERDVEAFDEEATRSHMNRPKGTQEASPREPCSASFGMALATAPGQHKRKLGPGSQLCSWPIQMRLAHADAPYFKDAKLLIAADCSGFASNSISDLIKGKVVLIGCPKLDEVGSFVDKLTEILRNNDIKEISVLHMEVPCCAKLIKLVPLAIERSGKKVPLDQYVCGIEGGIEKAKATSFKMIKS